MEFKGALICHYFLAFRKNLNNYFDYKREECDILSHYEMKFLICHFYYELKEKHNSLLVSSSDAIMTEDLLHC